MFRVGEIFGKWCFEKYLILFKGIREGDFLEIAGRSISFKFLYWLVKVNGFLFKFYSRFEKKFESLY